MEKIIEVSYKGTSNGEDIFYCKDTKRSYIRQKSNITDLICWLSASKWSGGYEADCPIREGIVVKVIDKYGDELFSETVGAEGLAEKNGNTFSEEVNKIASYAGFGLSDHRKWKEWLMEDAKKSGYTGYDDNWLYCMSVTGNKKIVSKVQTLYGQMQIVEYEMSHRISDKKWIERLLIGTDGETVEEICGRKLLGTEVETE